MSAAVAEPTNQNAAPAVTNERGPGTDAFGVVIKEGSVIAFAVRKGSDMWLNKLVVKTVSANKVTGYDPLDVRQRTKTLSNLSTTVVLSH